VRCNRCGNSNSEGNRFCGMCGAPLMPGAQNATQAPPARPSPVVPTVNAQLKHEPAGSQMRQERVTSVDGGRLERDPVISGPSFLGLNQPGRQSDQFDTGLRATSGVEQLRSSTNVDYLLDDEQEREPRRGWGKFFLIVVALALAAGFGYLHWKQGGFDWLLNGNKKPTTTQPDAGTSGPDSGAVATPTAPMPNATPVPSATSPASNPGGGGTNAGQPTITTAPSQPAPPQIAASQNPQPDSQPAPQPPVQTSPTGIPTQSASGASQPTGSASSVDSSAAAQSSSPDSDSDNSDDQDAAPKAALRKPASAKPAAAKPSPAKPADSVAEAQRYIYGRGVAKDCDRGLRMLKTSAGESNAQAMIALGSVYSTGTCAPRDLPTAYRWFAVALHKQPDNQALQNDLQNLWSQMTQPERQLAIKLSQ
jgi:zinc-ribbon domain